MPLPPTLNVALKEWDAVCRALAGGRQLMLLRKGGIYESAGEFEVEHRRFLLFPTFVHQSAGSLKPSARDAVRTVSAEPDQVVLAAAGEVTDVVMVKSRPQIDAIDDEHVWLPPLIDMRFSYKPQNPLYLLIVRAYRLPSPVAVANTPAYAGCKSWVPLDAAIDVAGATPALADDAFEARRQSILHRMAAAVG